jgi:hypothetical protein
VKIAGAAAPGTDCKRSSHVRVSAGGKSRYLLVALMDPLNGKVFFVVDLPVTTERYGGSLKNLFE